MPEAVGYIFIALVWMWLAIFLGWYIRLKGKGLKWQAFIGLVGILVSYLVGLILLWVGIISI